MVVVASAFAASPALAADAPIGLTASPRSDHLVQLDWSWPASPTYPDELDVRRDGVLLSTVSPSATTFQDVVPGAGSSHTYQLVPVTGGIADTPLSASVVLRADAPNKPTGVTASFAPDTNNLATVSWVRGASDADVTYTVTAQQVGGGPPNTRTVRYPDPGTAGSLTMDVFASYTTYTFKVTAVEDVNDPPGDPGGSVVGDPIPQATSFDVTSPTFTGSLSAARSSLGTVAATWPSATDSGTGVASYVLCVDASNCTGDIPVQPLESSQTSSVSGVRNDGAIHQVTVVAKDFNGNLSAPIGISLLMPIPAKPVIELTSGGTGCGALVAHATSSDTGASLPTFQLYVNGVPVPLDTVIPGAPYQQVSLTAQASSGPDLSETSTPILARINDPDPPDTGPEVHSRADQTAGTETLTWDPVYASSGAPIMKYIVTISTLPGYQGGVDVPQSDHPSATLAAGLEPTEYYIAQVTAVDACGRPSPPDFVRFQLDDITPPSAPVLAAPTADGRSIHLSWAASSDNVSVDEYLVYQVNKPDPIGHTPFTFFDITGLTDNYTGSYYVVATDTASNRSAASAIRTITTRDMTPPTPPGPLVQRPSSDGTITFGWTPASDNVAVVGYQVLRDGVPIQNVPASTSTFTDRNLAATSYLYQVRAYDAASNLSLPQSRSMTATAVPLATAASNIKAKLLRVGGSSGSRIVLSFKIPQEFKRAVLRLNVLKRVAMTKGRGNAKTTLKTKLRVSLPAGSGRTQAGKRLAERSVKKGAIPIPIGRQKAGTLRLVVTVTGGVLTLSGRGGSKAPTIVSASS